MTKIIAGTNGKNLAKQLSENLNIAQIEAFVECFADGELRVQLAARVNKEDVLIVQSTSKPVNDHLIEILLLVDAAKRSGAHRIIALMPYFGYSRQDHLSYTFGPISTHVVATLIEAAGIDHLITVDLHSQRTEKFFKINVQNIETTTLFAPLLQDRPNLIIVSPDNGGIIRARKLSELLGVNLAVISKFRKSHNTCQTEGLTGDVTGKHCIVIDDIVDTGETLCKAAELLMQHGALSVEAMVTHAVLSKKALANLEESEIKKVTITNTIEHTSLIDKLTVVDIGPLLTNILRDLPE
jgi:ribose-phosphate pyrophosphokinase